jgi:uncharacterized protein YfaT (DUF1175 family)
VETVVRVGLARRISKQGRRAAVGDEPAHAQLEVPPCGRGVDWVIRVKREYHTKWAVDLAGLIRLAARGRQTGAVDPWAHGRQLRGRRVRDGDAPNDPSERLKREEHDLARLVPDDLAEAKGGDHHYADEPAKDEHIMICIGPWLAADANA